MGEGEEGEEWMGEGEEGGGWMGEGEDVWVCPHSSNHHQLHPSVVPWQQT